MEQRKDETIKMLKECDAGIKMGISSIDDVLESVEDQSMKQKLNHCRNEHEVLLKKTQNLLDQYHHDGKEPNPVAKGMSWMKINAKMLTNPSDQTIADLITDGCNMGVKSLTRYMNQYQAADADSKNIARDLIRLEERLTVHLRDYL